MVTSGTDGGSEADTLWTAAAIEQNHRWLLAFLFAACGNRSVAEDLVQETFAEAYRNRAAYRKTQPFGAWLRGIARNILKREAERNGRAPVLLGEQAWDHAETTAAALEQRHVDPAYEESRIMALRQCVLKLTARARSLIEGRYRENLSIEALAQRTGLTPASVPVVLFRSRTALSDCIKKKLRESGCAGGTA